MQIEIPPGCLTACTRDSAGEAGCEYPLNPSAGQGIGASSCEESPCEYVSFVSTFTKVSRLTVKNCS